MEQNSTAIETIVCQSFLRTLLASNHTPSTSTMHISIIIPTLLLLGANTIQASVVAERAAENGRCTGSGGAPGVCIPTAKCNSGGGKYISGACPGTPNDIKCCTKPSCGTGGNCRWTSQCSSGNTLTGLCPGPADFKCCVPGGGGGGGGGPFAAPAIPSVGACKAAAVSGAQKVVAGNPGKVRQIYCTRECGCTSTSSDHCCGMAIDFMCSSAGGVGVSPRFIVPRFANTACRWRPRLGNRSLNGS
jgi:hypothetical protein